MRATHSTQQFNASIRATKRAAAIPETCIGVCRPSATLERSIAPRHLEHPQQQRVRHCPTTLDNLGTFSSSPATTIVQQWEQRGGRRGGRRRRRRIGHIIGDIGFTGRSQCACSHCPRAQEHTAPQRREVSVPVCLSVRPSVCLSGRRPAERFIDDQDVSGLISQTLARSAKARQARTNFPFCLQYPLLHPQQHRRHEPEPGPKCSCCYCWLWQSKRLRGKLLSWSPARVCVHLLLLSH